MAAITNEINWNWYIDLTSFSQADHDEKIYHASLSPLFSFIRIWSE
jgi:hypothetical protein